MEDTGIAGLRIERFTAEGFYSHQEGFYSHQKDHASADSRPLPDVNFRRAVGLGLGAVLLGLSTTGLLSRPGRPDRPGMHEGGIRRLRTAPRRTLGRLGRRLGRGNLAPKPKQASHRG